MTGDCVQEEEEDIPYSEDELVYALDRLALGFESADPHIRHEAKMVAKQEFRGIVEAIERSESC